MHGNGFQRLLVGAGVLLAALLVVGLPFGTALPSALLLACPLVMGAMMAIMIRGGGRGHGAHHDHHRPEPPAADQSPTSVRDRSRVR